MEAEPQVSKFTIQLPDGSTEVVHHTDSDPYIINNGMYESNDGDHSYPIVQEPE